MSIIEQAAKRLEELRRSTDDATLGAPVASPERPYSSLPTPEAFVHALDTWHGDHASHAAPHAQSPHKPSRTAHTEARAPRHIDIDLAQLKMRGLVSPEAPRSAIADEFRILKRPIIRNALGQDGARIKNSNLVMVTSAVPGEGKTFTSINLALSIAMEVDSTVLLVDGDVAHPTIPSLLGCPHAPGLLDVLTRDDVDLADAMVKTNVDKLTLLPAGSRHRQSTELLASAQMLTLLRELASRYPDRIIIFDSPPLLPTTEARVLATHMGQIVVVVAADSTPQHAVTQALAMIDSCDVVLMMLNKATRTKLGGYYAYYGDDTT
jgi:protein-tyrosine kinase